MSKHSIVAATLALLAPALASAQSADYNDGRSSIVIFANGGGYSPLSD